MNRFLLVHPGPAAGDKNAADVVLWYQLYVRCPEAGAMVVCEEAFKAWRKQKEMA